MSKSSNYLKIIKPEPPLLLLVTGAIFFVSVFQAPKTYAITLNIPKIDISDSPMKVNQKRINALENKFKMKQKSIESKEKEVSKAVDESANSLQEKVKVQENVESLKSSISDLDDMFVHVSQYAKDASGNSYAVGNCTWYVKTKRPDIGNFWGNANSWYQNAQLAGFKVGSKAKVGAVGTTQEGWAGHVVYVEKVSRDGNTVTISEMNYGGLYRMNTRTLPSSSFNYIYEKS